MSTRLEEKLAEEFEVGTLFGFKYNKAIITCFNEELEEEKRKFTVIYITNKCIDLLANEIKKFYKENKNGLGFELELIDEENNEKSKIDLNKLL